MSAARQVLVELPGWIDLPVSLRPLSRWGDDGIDRWDGHRLLRTVRVGDGGQPVAFAARRMRLPEAQALEAQLEDPQPAEPFASAVRDGLVPRPDSRRALAELARADPAVARLAERYPGLAPVQFPDPFTALVRSISAQQVNLRWAAEIRRRLAIGYGHRHAVAGEWVFSLSPDRLVEASVAELRGLQLTNAKAASLLACARAALDGGLERHDLDRLDDDAVVARLTALPGIGRWSAEWFLARTLGRPRVVAGDLGVRKAVGRLYLGGGLPSEDEVRRLTVHWGAASALAQALALHDLAESPPPAGARVSRSPRPAPRLRAG